MIDIHAHWYPKRALEAFIELSSGLVTSAGSESESCLLVNGAVALQLDPVMSNLDERIRLLDETGIDTQILSIGALDIGWAGENAGPLAFIVNDELGIMASDGTRFAFACAVPLNDAGGAKLAIARAVRDGAVAASCTSTYGGLPLDAPELRDGLRAIADVGLPLLIHPCSPRLGLDGAGPESIAVGFPAETMIAAARCVTSGLLDSLPNLRFVWSHLGGGLAMAFARLNASRRTSGRTDLSAVALTSFYFDAVTSDIAALRCAIDVFGPDRIMFGTDMPHRLEAPHQVLSAIDGACATPTVLQGMLDVTARKLFEIAG